MNFKLCQSDKRDRQIISEAKGTLRNLRYHLKGVVAHWCSPLTLQQEQFSRVGAIPGRVTPFEHHDKGLQT